jgi:hypothetical protein
MWGWWTRWRWVNGFGRWRVSWTSVAAGCGAVAEARSAGGAGSRRPRRRDGADAIRMGIRELERFMDAGTRGHPGLPARWSFEERAQARCRLGRARPWGQLGTGAGLLRALGDSLQANRTTPEGADHPHGDARFELINKTEGADRRFKNGGRECRTAASEPAIAP